MIFAATVNRPSVYVFSLQGLYERFTFKALYWKSCKKRTRRPFSARLREAKRGETALKTILYNLD
jgi:hypothetical protein